MSATRPVSFIFAACLMAAATLQAADTYGTGVTVSQVTPLADVIARPADFEGKTVRVDGVVTAVCTHMGCWMALAPDSGSAAAGSTTTTPLMIKVDDGVIVFPVSAKGRRASAQGVVQKVGGDAEGQSAAREHAAATATVPGAAPADATQPASWQIKATGAVVH